MGVLDLDVVHGPSHVEDQKGQLDAQGKVKVNYAGLCRGRLDEQVLSILRVWSAELKTILEEETSLVRLIFVEIDLAILQVKSEVERLADAWALAYLTEIDSLSVDISPKVVSAEVVICDVQVEGNKQVKKEEKDQYSDGLH